MLCDRVVVQGPFSPQTLRNACFMGDAYKKAPPRNRCPVRIRCVHGTRTHQANARPARFESVPEANMHQMLSWGLHGTGTYKQLPETALFGQGLTTLWARFVFRPQTLPANRNPSYLNRLAWSRRDFPKARFRPRYRLNLAWSRGMAAKRRREEGMLSIIGAMSMVCTGM